MTVSIKHKFTSTKADGLDSSLIQPSNWNDQHDITLAAGKVLGRDSSGSGAVQELPLAFDATGQSFIPPSGTTAQRPATAAAGMFRYNTTQNRVELYNGTAWGSVGGGATVSATAPAAPQTGDFWYDTANGLLKTYNGTAWVSPSPNAYVVRQTFVAVSGQTSFTVSGGYTPNSVDVYQNGVKLVNGVDVDVSSGTSVVLATGALASDYVEVLGVAAVGTAFLPTTGGTLTGTLNGTNATFSGSVSDGSGTIRPLISGTSQATTSGTAINFTGIPSWVKRVTVMLNGVSLSGVSSYVALQLGAGGVTTTGYSASSSNMSNSVSSAVFTQGFCINGGAAANAYNGQFICSHVGGNAWVVTGLFQTAGAINTWTVAGMITLTGVLDRVRLASTGTDTFDAGSVNILYE